MIIFNNINRLMVDALYSIDISEKAMTRTGIKPEPCLTMLQEYCGNLENRPKCEISNY